MADVPLGVLLSGGVDSSAVAALAAPARDRPHPHLHHRLRGRRLLRRAARTRRRWPRHLGAEHHDGGGVRPHAAELMETLLHHHDEPFGDSSALPTYLVAREARRHVTVALNGDGGDETFAGYDRFHAALLGRAAARPGPARAARGLAPAAGRPPRPRHAAPPPALRAQGGAARGRADLRLERVLRPPRAAPRSTADGLARRRDAPRRPTAKRWRAAPAPRSCSRLLYLNARTYLLDDLLPKMDRMTMAHGLEARSPLLDRDLMEYVASLPDDFKRRGRPGQGRAQEARSRTCCPPRSCSGPNTASACRWATGSAASCGRWSRTRCSTGRGWPDDCACRPCALWSTSTWPGGPITGTSSGACSPLNSGYASTSSPRPKCECLRLRAVRPPSVTAGVNPAVTMEETLRLRHSELWLRKHNFA